MALRAWGMVQGGRELVTVVMVRVNNEKVGVVADQWELLSMGFVASMVTCRWLQGYW